jgi:Gas vesicle synthesis protein GvpL/GvpF
MKKGLISKTRKAKHGGAALLNCGRHEAAAPAPAPDQPAEGPVWVYAVTTGLDPDRLSGLTGVAGEPVRAVTESGLSAVVGSLGDEDSGGTPLSSLLVGLSAIETTGRAHHDVIAHLAWHLPVVPVRLATVYPDDTMIRVLLAERHAELTVLLDSFRGTQEWGVKMYLEPWADGAGDDTFSSLVGEPCQWPRWGRAEEDAERIGYVLSDMAVATRRHPFPVPRSGGRRMVHNGSYLLDAGRAGEFTEVVASVAASHAALRADVTGPWPPYSFADRQDLW